MITEEQKREIINRIIELKTKLHKSDYQALKYAEGEITASDYAPILTQRREWRAEINVLEAQIATNNQ
jgi:hypothetical protein